MYNLEFELSLKLNLAFPMEVHGSLLVSLTNSKFRVKATIIGFLISNSGLLTCLVIYRPSQIVIFGCVCHL